MSEPAGDPNDPKPALWRGKAEGLGSWLFRAVIGLTGLALAAWFSFPWVEEQFLSDAAPTVVEVVAVTGQSPDRHHQAFRHTVRLPDASTALFWTDRVHAPGERLLVMAVRGRITHRLLLRSPLGGEQIEHSAPRR
jgi:hypothetical protein